jgi:hypothetical protein
VYRGLSYLKYQKEKLLEFLKANPGMIVSVNVKMRLRYDEGGDEYFVIQDVGSRKYTILNVEDLNDAIKKMPEDIITLVASKQLGKSNLVVDGIDQLIIHYNRYNPTRGGSYIELPKWIADKKACINIKNTDNKCFKYSILCGILETYKKITRRNVSL